MHIEADGGPENLRVLDFGMVGGSRNLRPAASKASCIFVVSTFNTDYLYIKSKSLQHTVRCWGTTDILWTDPRDAGGPGTYCARLNFA
jgi:hypothetical protein